MQNTIFLILRGLNYKKKLFLDNPQAYLGPNYALLLRSLKNGKSDAKN